MMYGSGLGNALEAGEKVVPESEEDTHWTPDDGICTVPAMVGTGGGMGIGVGLAAVKTLKDTGTSIAGTAMTFPAPEGWLKTAKVSCGARNTV